MHYLDILQFRKNDLNLIQLNKLIPLTCGFIEFY
jgi:hypothetical protein